MLQQKSALESEDSRATEVHEFDGIHTPRQIDRYTLLLFSMLCY